jgi:anti-anti-sigma factor
MELQLERSQTIEKLARDVTVVHFAGRKVSLDEGSIGVIRDRMFALADEPSESDVFLDFGNVEFLTSTALGTLVSLHKKLFSQGRNLTVGNVSPYLHQVFAITKLDTFLNLRVAGQEIEDSPFDFPTGVLVVDDDTAVLCALAARLRNEGYKVWVASHGQRAVEFYRRHREEIALVLLDARMPGMDGPNTLTALQQICPTVRCCFMVGNPTFYAEESLIAMGAIRIFQKPFPFTEVIDTLNQLASRPREVRWLFPLKRSV